MISETIITFLQRSVCQGIPLLYGATGEILTEKSGNLNLGIPGIMYIGSISGVIGAFFYEQSLSSPDMINPVLAVFIPVLCSLLGSLIAGLIYCFLTVTLRANQNVTGLALTTFGVGFGNFFGGSLIKLTGSAVPSVALTNTSAYFKKSLPFADSLGAFGKIFLSYGFLVYLAILVAIVCAVFLRHTRGGLHLRAVGENPATADAAGINVERSKYLATCIGSMIAGLGGLYYVMDYASGVWSNDGFGNIRFFPFRRALYCLSLYSGACPAHAGDYQNASVYCYNYCSDYQLHARQKGKSGPGIIGFILLQRGEIVCLRILKKCLFPKKNLSRLMQGSAEK